VLKICLVMRGRRRRTQIIALSTVAIIGGLAIIPASASAQSFRRSSLGANNCLRTLILKSAQGQKASPAAPWTIERMDTAKPFSETALTQRIRHMLKTTSRHRLMSEATTPAVSSCVSLPPNSDRSARFGSGPSHIIPDTHAFDGYPSVGKLFFNSLIGRKSCTAEVITSPKPLLKGGSDLILTAAHCVLGVVAGYPYSDTDFVFAPKWANGRAPFGRWPVQIHHIFLDSRWFNCPVIFFHCSTNPNFDYSFMIVSRPHGVRHNLGHYTGWNGFFIGVNSGLSGVRIIGYTESSPKPLTSTTDIFLFGVGSSTYLDGSAPGEGDGSSGGPWFGSLDTRSGLGILIGDTGGFHGGGPSSGVPTFSPLWTKNFLKLDEAARKAEAARKHK
jgi:hypothetical protein